MRAGAHALKLASSSASLQGRGTKRPASPSKATRKKARTKALRTNSKQKNKTPTFKVVVQSPYEVPWNPLSVAQTAEVVAALEASVVPLVLAAEKRDTETRAPSVQAQALKSQDVAAAAGAAAGTATATRQRRRRQAHDRPRRPVRPRYGAASGLIVGVNAVTRALEKGQADCILVVYPAHRVPGAPRPDRSMTESLETLLQHLPILSSVKRTRMCCLQTTGTRLGEALGLTHASVVALLKPVPPTVDVPIVERAALAMLLDKVATHVRVPWLSTGSADGPYMPAQMSVTTNKRDVQLATAAKGVIQAVIENHPGGNKEEQGKK